MSFGSGSSSSSQSRMRSIIPRALRHADHFQRLGHRQLFLCHQSPHDEPFVPKPGRPASFFWASMMRAWEPASSRSTRNSSFTESRCFGLRWSRQPTLPRSRNASRQRYAWLIATPWRWQRLVIDSWPFTISSTTLNFSSTVQLRRDMPVSSVCLGSILPYSGVQFKRGAFRIIGK